MQDEYLKKIDFDQILLSIFKYVSNPDTVNLINEQKMLRKEKTLEEVLCLVSSIKNIIKTYKEYPNSSLNSLKDIISLLFKKKSKISIEALRDIILFLQEVVKINFFLDKKNFNIKVNVKILKDLLILSPELRYLLDYLCKYIDIVDLNLKSGVVKEYDAIEFEINNLNKRIEKQVKQIINLNSNYLTSYLVYYKSSKYTIALKASFKNKVKGNVISVSSSGETFYVEPNELMSDNNKLSFLSFERLKIVQRILQELSNKVHENISFLKVLYNNFLYYDSLKARAIYGIKTNGVFPLISNVINIVNAYHPLVKFPKKINFIPSDKHIVIITGPNAGGKTVTLKTVALLSVMFQFGIPVPVDESSTFKIFDNIFIEIGDEQSVLTSLSTFSSHMINISYILKHATENSLIILDEFCSGTDIDQGQALAISILEYLVDINSYVLISTHYNALKHFAYVHKNVINASMQMNLETMQPSYSLIFSIPGESFAFNVASSALIDNRIITRANEIYLSRKTEVNEILEKLIEKEKEILILDQKIKQKAEKIELKEKELDSIHQSFLIKEKNIENKLFNEQKEFLRHARKILENLVREIKEGNISVTKNQEFVNYLENNISYKANKIKSLNDNIDLSTTFKIGDKVRIIYSNIGGEIVKITKKGVVVNNGVFNINVSNKDLILEDFKRYKKNENKNFSFSVDEQDDILSFIIDIRGMRSFDAIDFLNKKIDNMILNNVNKFEIVHGKGKGLLMKEVHKLLESLKFVKKYYLAHLKDGGSGKTIVEI